MFFGSEAKDPVKEKEEQKQRAKAARKQRREQGEQLLFHADEDGTCRAMFRLRRESCHAQTVSRKKTYASYAGLGKPALAVERRVKQNMRVFRLEQRWERV